MENTEEALMRIARELEMLEVGLRDIREGRFVEGEALERVLDDFENDIGAPMNIIYEIATERARQVEAEGWSPGHDDQHTQGELGAAAASYIQSAVGLVRGVPILWPWHTMWWKPTSPRRDLVKAAALIVAEIERLDRAAK